MATDTFTLTLEGKVSLEQFAKAADDFYKLLTALALEVEPGLRVDWEIADLRYGSAAMTAVAETRTERSLDSVVRAYESVGQSLRAGRPIPYGPKIRGPAERIVGLIDGRIPAVRFETVNMDVTVVGEHQPLVKFDLTAAYGMVEGRVQTLSSRTQLRFTLYDRAHDTAVSCYVDRDREDLLRDIWGKRAIVEGWVSRTRETGRPVSVRQIEQIRPLPEAEPHHYEQARGAVPIAAGEPASEVVIRELRNAWGK